MTVAVDRILAADHSLVIDLELVYFDSLVARLGFPAHYEHVDPPRPADELRVLRQTRYLGSYLIRMGCASYL